MGFENTRMGAKFFNKDFPELVKSINRVGQSIEDLIQLKTSRKEQHYYDLLNQIINHVSNSENNSTTIKTLLCWGFTAEDLIQDFNFNESDVRGCIENINNFDSVY